jgi:CDP-diacylglycerol--serine O-phosphatidyltransferase
VVCSASMAPRDQKHLSMLRSYTPADLLTLANAVCGTLSVFACLSYMDDDRSRQIWAAFVLPIFALVFDVLDGYVARLDSHRQSRLGADLDSLADIVSFGVAPAVLAYTLGLRGLWDVAVLTFFVCCGISRLARFNATASQLTNTATGKVRYFEGTPIPTSIVLVLLLAALYHLGLTGENFWWGHVNLAGRGFHPISLLFLASGSLMVSTIKVPKP